MDKLLLFPGKTDRGIFTYVVDTEHQHLVKTAAEYHPEIAAYINSAQKIPGKTQILLTALGAYEFWHANINGDAFMEADLAHEGPDYGHGTFVTNAKIYKHHINKDPSASYGDVVLAVYNYRYHRVELIVVLDNAKAPDIAERIDNGEYPDWSMGVRVKFDICSICQNKAPTRKEYCEHLKYYMGRIHPGTGKMAYAINPRPVFFDISQVLIGADRIAKTLRKVASVSEIPIISSALLAEKMAVADKAATIEKEIPASEPPASQESIGDLANSITEVKSQEKPMPTEVLNQLGANPLDKVFSTLSMLGILPKPQEFQRIVLVSIGKRDLADQLDSKNMSFDPMMAGSPAPAHMNLVPMSEGGLSPSLMSLLSPHVPDRSYYAPHLSKRLIIMIKNAGQEQEPVQFIKAADEDRKPLGILPLMMLIAGMYAAFGKKAPQNAVGLDKAIAKNPGLAMALAASAPMIFNQIAGTNVKGKFDAAGVPENPDVSNLLERIEEKKKKPFLKVGAIGPFTKRLMLGVPAAYMASGVLQKHKEANPFEQEGRIKAFVRQYPDIIGAALAADAMLALHGKGTHGLLKKFGSAMDFVSNALVWPLAFGGANLPAKVLGGLGDQAMLELSKKVLSNKKEDSIMNHTNRRM